RAPPTGECNRTPDTRITSRAHGQVRRPRPRGARAGGRLSAQCKPIVSARKIDTLCPACGVKRGWTEITEKAHERPAIVIGGSIAGLFVGAFLRRIGWRVDIYERSSIELIGRGVGIFATHLELLEALDKCGAGTVDIGVIVYKRIAFDRSGKVIA